MSQHASPHSLTTDTSKSDTNVNSETGSKSALGQNNNSGHTLSSLIPSKHQAAGHDGCLESPNDGTIFAKLANQQEIEFYMKTQTLSEADAEREKLSGSSLADWMPTYYGTLTEGTLNPSASTSDNNLAQPDANSIILPVSPEDEAHISHSSTPKSHSEVKQYIVLSNLYQGFRKPSILDIKLGAILTDDQAKPEKRDRLRKVSESTTSGSHGFRICGMRLYQGSDKKSVQPLFPNIEDTVTLESESSHEYLQFDKFFGRSLDGTNVQQAILLFFGISNNSTATKLLIRRFYQRLQLLYNCLIDTEVRIISGSLLFIYENDASQWSPVANAPEDHQETIYDVSDPLVRETPIESSDSEECEEDEGDQISSKAPLSSLNLIDFAHAKYVPGSGCDENVLKGIDSLLSIFENLLDEP